MMSSTVSSLSVSVTVEPLDEYQVQDITYDGQEKYIQPLSMSDNFTKLVSKIDFSKIDNESNDTNNDMTDTISETNEVDDSKELATFQPSLWPFDSIRNKLKQALTEVTVLTDVLTVVKDKRYMILDPVSQETNDMKPITALIAKKKALQVASQILSNGAERIRVAQSEATKNRATDFHTELFHMRQNWRLRKKENSILGDLSYRSAGSRFPHTGTFEVTKNEDQVSTGTGPRASALKVKVPADLEGGSFFQVKTQKANADLNWHQKLENAQNVLFNKELFAQLAREAVDLKLSIPTTVIGNKIIASLFPGVQLSIVLCHTTINGKIMHQKSSPLAIPSKQDSPNKPVLEHSLHQLLREMHHNTLHHPMPHPTTATLGVSCKRYLAGPEAYDRQTIIEMNKNDTILEQIISQTQHDLLRLRTMYMIDTTASEIKDPIIVAHWLCLNSATKSSVKINIVSYGYESLCRTPLVIHISTKSLKAILRDGRVINMSYESQELRYLLLNQISQHQIFAIQALSKPMGWKVLSLNINVGVGHVEPIGTASSIVLVSPNGDRFLAIRCGPYSGIEVKMCSSPQEFYPSALVRDRKWQNLTGSYREVDWEKIEGKNFVNKIEYLMASLVSY
ncbi:mediator of RNA polymerase II transcription subunit 17-like isoform X2 [Oppia nitens]|uniref:mediator of RNA polymerase II transcription subunit 17-like isoform X2 n=1 Tax=Oppia nitens TaxID=1686743 RepID=UPI0023DC98B2|nr:mediator of RNA polymerase II transcription subunit 17-like isoform X2 [Oppia nitens]